ncbi:MAG: macro domain-containing protein [Eggerthellaceae bacterium]|nr:macro domain-containing protein [Eggerthellaceae bacterium]
MDERRKVELLRGLVRMLVEERCEREGRGRGGWAFAGLGEPEAYEALAATPGATADELWRAFRSLVNVRPPWPVSDAFLRAQDELLQGLIAEAGVSTVTDALPVPATAGSDASACAGGVAGGGEGDSDTSNKGDAARAGAPLFLWRGDITTFAADAVVNAANAQMMGCWAPLHYCIDNAIHTFAGVQLRAECARLMREQGHDEPTGQAKVTPAYNLPARLVVHTVGPIAAGRPTDEHRAQLAQSYRSCLEAADAAGAHSIALCGISTGVFGFPLEEAARIAVRTVRAWAADHPHAFAGGIVFDAFLEREEAVYRDVLGMA